MKRRTRGMRVWWVAAALVPVLCAGCSATETDSTERNTAGEVVEGGDVGVNKLQVGDCISKAALAGTPESSSASPAVDEVESLPAVPCSEPHGGEVVLVDSAFFQSLSERPTDDELFTKASDRCLTEIKTYTGFDLDAYLAAEEQPDTKDLFVPYTLVPTPDSWEQAEDRSMTCIALSVKDDLETVTERTGTAKAS